MILRYISLILLQEKYNKANLKKGLRYIAQNQVNLSEINLNKTRLNMTMCYFKTDFKA